MALLTSTLGQETWYRVVGMSRPRLKLRAGLVRQVERHAGNDHRRQGLKGMMQPLGDVLLNDAVPPVPVHEIGNGNGQRKIWPFLVQSPDVVDQWGHHGAVRRDDDLERQVISPRPPVTKEPVSLFAGRAHVQRERGLAECGSVRQRLHCGPVHYLDRDDGECIDLRGLLSASGLSPARDGPARPWPRSKLRWERRWRGGFLSADG